MEGSTHLLRTNSTSASEHPCATQRDNQQAVLTICLLYFKASQGSAHSFVFVDKAVCELHGSVFDAYSPALGRTPQVLALRHVPQKDVESRAEMEGSTYELRTNTTSASEHPCVK